MKVNIDSLFDFAEELVVIFSTEFGFAVASWKGVPPKIDRLYDVEMEVEGRVDWRGNANPASSDICSIGIIDGTVNLTGSIISVDAEGVVAIDVGGSIVFLEVNGFSGRVPVFADLKIERLNLFPTGI